jgi:hypothetical protein
MALEQRLGSAAMDCFITRDLERLPRYGRDVMAVVVGDEYGKVPRYAGKVAAVFMHFGIRHPPTVRPFRQPPTLTALAALLDARVLVQTLPGRARWRSWEVAARLRGRELPPIVAIPLGWFHPPPGGVPSMADRPNAATFVGSLQTNRERTGPLRRVPTAKQRSRAEMLTRVHRLGTAHPELTIDIAMTGDYRQSKRSAPEEYWRRLCAAKIALVPRGNVPETYRLYEAARAGCIAVTEQLPHHPFCQEAPAVEVPGWRGLEDVLLGLLEDDARLDEGQRATLEWWERCCSVESVARRMAGVLEEGAGRA